MSDAPRAGITALALICSVALAAPAALAQNGSSTSPSASATAQGKISASQDQAQSFLKSLENFVKQPAPNNYKPSVGSSVPQNVKTHPMPPAAQAALPDAKDHHIAKTDDQTVLIVDPITREVVGIITGSDDGKGSGSGASGGGSGSSQ